MNWIREKKNVLIFILACGAGFAILYVYSINGYLPGYTGGNIFRFTWHSIFFITPIYGTTALFLLFFKERLLKKWFIYSLFFTIPILLINMLMVLYPNKSGFVGGEAFVLLPIGILAILLFITTPFFLYWQSKRIINNKK